jgi:hypothetical protein
LARLQLRPGLRRLWRDQSTLQLGLSPAHGAVLSGLRAGDDVVLAALDGRHDLRQLHALARARSVPGSRVDELVRLLGNAGVLVRRDPGRAPAGRPLADPRLVPDAASWALAYGGSTDPAALVARRARARVVVDGLGRLGAAVAATLAGAGIGRVEGLDAASVSPRDVLAAGHGSEDVGTPRVRSLGRAMERVLGRPPEPAAPDRSTRQGPLEAPPDLVVLVRDDAVELGAADDLVHRGVDHLAVVVGADRVVVGPLVVPGRGSCLRCLHLHRCDRDPAWPQLAAQLTGGAPDPVSGARGETGSATAAAGLVTLQVLTHLDGIVRPVSAGRTLDLVLPDGLVERRRWTAHPRCGCNRLPVTDSADRDELTDGLRLAAPATPPVPADRVVRAR